MPLPLKTGPSSRFPSGAEQVSVPVGSLQRWIASQRDMLMAGHCPLAAARCDLGACNSTRSGRRQEGLRTRPARSASPWWSSWCARPRRSSRRGWAWGRRSPAACHAQRLSMRALLAWSSELHKDTCGCRRTAAPGPALTQGVVWSISQYVYERCFGVARRGSSEITGGGQLTSTL